MGKATKKILDFTNVKDGADYNPVHQPEGEYLLEIVGVDETPSKGGNDMWTFKCKDVNKPRATYPHRCTLNVEALWKIRNLFVACGVNVPKKKVNVDPNKLIGKQFGAMLADDEYEGKMKSVIEGVFPASDMPAPSSKTKSNRADDEEPEVDEDMEVDEEIEDEVEVDDL